MKPKLVILGVVVIAMLGVVGYSYRQRKPVILREASVVQVTASFYPLAEFARQVGGALVQVATVVPADIEPHEFEPTPPEIAQIYASDVFIYNGSGLDPWAEQIASELQRQGVRIMKISDQVAWLSAPVVEGEESEGPYDPHFWLDPVLAQAQIAAIRDVLITLDPEGAATYRSQSEKYLVELQRLDQAYREGLAACSRREIVTSHAAFGYLAKRYNLSVINITGISPEEEPSPRRLSEIAELAKENKIRYIFFETLASPKLAETIAAEIGAQTLVFNPLEGLTHEEKQAGEDYLSLMQSNLQNLQIAMECK